MSNATPRGYNELVQLAEDAADGADTHGATIGLNAVTPTTIRTALNALIGEPAGPGGVPPAIPGLKALWNAARANKTAKSALLRTAKSNGRYHARMCIRSLTPALGESWNSAWNAAGFTSGSLAVPDNPLPMLQQLRAYYGANPTKEDPDAQGLALTAAACETHVQLISDASEASLQSNTDSGNARNAYETGIDLLYTVLSNLLKELTIRLTPDDERWLAFGYEKPSDPGTPTIPENLVVTPGAPGSKTLLVDFDDGRRDHSYRILAYLQGTTDEIANQIVTDSDALLTFPTLAPGTLVDVRVTGRNDKGETQPSEPVTASVP